MAVKIINLVWYPFVVSVAGALCSVAYSHAQNQTAVVPERQIEQLETRVARLERTVLSPSMQQAQFILVPMPRTEAELREETVRRELAARRVED